MKTYVCTCGTSIITKRGINLERILHQPLSAWDEKFDDLGNIRDQVSEILERIQLPKGLNATSAEIKSLVKMEIRPDDRVILIASDTVDGKLCAELVRSFLLKKEICHVVEIKTIPGLQAKDGKAFQRDGLKNLLGYLISLEHEDIILNSTGGFKSVVPYISLIGMIFNRPVKYIHEDSEDVITLSNVPVIMNDGILLLVENKLRKIEKESAISKGEWLSGLDYYDRRFDSLIEEYGGQVTLSGIGLLFWERFKRDYPEELARDEAELSDKPNKLNERGVTHHGIEKLKPLALKLLQSPFIKSIPNSCDNQPSSKAWIKALTSEEAMHHLQRAAENICIVTHIKTDAGFSFLLETTARNNAENKNIAEILMRKYFD